MIDLDKFDLVELRARTNGGRPCLVGRLLEELASRETPEVVDRIRQALDDEHIVAQRLADLLASSGYRIGTHSIRRHRLRLTGAGCLCR